MKRFLALTLVVIITVTALTACSNTKDKTDDAVSSNVIETDDAVSSSAFETDDASPSSAIETDDAGSSSGYEKGTLDTTSFESKYLDLRFTLPEGYVMATEDEMNSMMDLGADIMGVDEKIIDFANITTVYEMMASAPSGYPSVILMAEKLLLSNMTVEQYIDALKTQLSSLDTVNYEFNSDMLTTEIAGQSYTQFTITTNISGQDLTQNYIIRKVDDRMVAFIGTCTPDTEEALITLMNGFSIY